MLASAPGGGWIQFENAPFKLTQEFLDVLGGECSPQSKQRAHESLAQLEKGIFRTDACESSVSVPDPKWCWQG